MSKSKNGKIIIDIRNIYIYNKKKYFRVKRQEDSQELVNLARGSNALIQKSHLILQAISGLKESQHYQNVQLINTVDQSFSQGKLELPFKEFLLGLEQFVRKGEIINMQYKC